MLRKENKGDILVAVKILDMCCHLWGDIPTSVTIAMKRHTMHCHDCLRYTLSFPVMFAAGDMSILNATKKTNAKTFKQRQILNVRI